MANDITALKKLSENSTDEKYKLIFSSKFKKKWKKYSRSGRYDFIEVSDILHALSRGSDLDSKYRNHALKGNWVGFKECHIQGDLLLIYRIEDEELKLADLGTHSELFGN